MRYALTPDGVAMVGLAVVLVAVGVWLGRQGVVLAGGLVGGALAGGEVVSALGLSRLRVSRTPPEDPVAGSSAWGLWRVSAGRWPVPPFRVADGDGRGGSEVAALAPGEHRVAPARWRWPKRGAVQLGEVTVESVGWFGVVRRRMLRRQHGLLVVGVAPRQGAVTEEVVPGASCASLGGVDPEFEDVRDWRAGEPWRLVHAARSARAGRALVVTRRPVDDATVGLRLREDDPDAFEADLSAVAFRIRAEPGTRFVVRHGEEALGVDVGVASRRRALDTLALWETP